ncbi:S8 family serine peptidase [Flavobacterium sp. TP390]|uniref:S8 family serine peptidase n=1 Tax=Flavobacterium profundi TaxID=1774945 RepID=A0A6I4ILH5_9FLAO|nr:S8 family serine peptidase [Flavobacterium profundi]MVO09261.1 S8 family serine peptidase [Flavobacterium profundi]
MKKSILFFLIGSLVGFAQSKAEIETIKKSYNANEVISLKETITNFVNEREARIKNFLLGNTNKNREYYNDGTKYMLFDIVDNKPVYIATDNRLSAMAAKTNTLYPGGSLGLSLTGAGMKVGVWDGGWALVNHQEFMNNSTSRITTPDTAAPIPTADLHATHVVGTVSAAGIMSSAKGMAYEVNVASYNWTNDETEVTNEATNSGLLISNHSYGVPIYNDNGDQNVPDWYMGCYNSDARQWDQIMHTLPYYLMVTSGGNSGNDSYSNGLYPGLDKLTGNKNCKNNLVIANANPTVHPITGVMSNLVINSSSSEGPTDDGRIKPDIAADGTNLYSTSNESTTSYATLTGTSMASPSTAGSLILLQQHYNNLNAGYMLSATLKGLVCHTALDDANRVGPDPYFGWGFLNTKEAAELITNANNSSPTASIQELSMSQTSGVYTYQVVVNSPKTLRATICWNDVAGGSKDNQLNSSTPVLVNDLDIRITKDAETYFPWKLDLNNLTSPAIKGDNIVDNVEKVEVENASGIYTITVSKKGFFPAAQQYSLIISGFDQMPLNSKSFESNVAVYPNPAEDKLFINSAKNAILGYEIVDTQGRIVKKEKLNSLSDFSINIATLNSGMYLVFLQSEVGTSTHKIVKK